MHELIKTWTNLRPDQGRYVLQQDLAILEGYKKAEKLMTPLGYNWAKYRDDPLLGSGDDRRLHLSLIPEPYVGNLDEAKVVVLLLNPGLTPSDYYAREKDSAYREALLTQLRGRGIPGDYPFLHLNPEFSWQDGFRWWNLKLRDVIKHGAKLHFNGSVQHARQAIAKRVAALELVPYHSESFGVPDPVLRKLRSVQLALDYVRTVLVPRAERGECQIVVTRKVADWGLGELPGVIRYASHHARSASLSADSEGGKAILAALAPKAIHAVDPIP
jgi:hypothetical protein